MEWIPLLEEHTGRFADVLATGDLAAPVPACPDWTLADLGEHLRSVHAWATHAVVEGNPDGAPPPVAGPGREALVAGYREAAGSLVAVLRRTPPDAPAWTFGPAPVSAFWRRRQVHEVTMHVYDALASQGRAEEWSIAPELAWDGVDEVVSLFYPRQVERGRTEELAGTVRLVATDVDGGVLDLGSGEPVVELGAPARELLLTLWKRMPAGDPAAAELLTAAVTP
ncbi:MAG TPA: maleylpyruvate isomerase N-terminal domain-containing protein [Nocardioides sp.]|nr:maleylpyruvate isomerase N-terminal domain-containing protein [Nocardioides sp.]